MQILPKDIVESFSYEYRNRPNNPLYTELRKLEIGEGLQVSQEEWTGKTKLNVAVANFGKRLGMKFSTRVVVGGAGWVIVRVS